MIKRLVSLLTATALLSCLCATSVFAKNDSVVKEPSEKSPPIASKSEPKPNEKLRADMLKLVADTKAGKIKMPAQQFPQHTKRNNLSTGAKIGIIAAIAGTIFLIVMFRALNSDDD